MAFHNPFDKSEHMPSIDEPSKRSKQVQQNEPHPSKISYNNVSEAQMPLEDRPEIIQKGSYPKLSLNPTQIKAAQTLSGNLLILASAGTGKTTTIVERYANLIESGIRPDEILMTTFTNKAAKDMLYKITQRTNQIPPHVGTMHSLFLKILRENSHLIFPSKRFTIIDDSDKKKIVKNLLIQKKIIANANNTKYLIGRISKFKNLGIAPETLRQSQEINLEEEKYIEMILEDEIIIIDSSVKENFVSLYQSYQSILKNNHLIDLDDILLLTHKLFENEEIRKRYSSHFQSIMVDEAQDLNVVQMKILNQLGRENICLIGDDCQNIYAWRGSSNDLVFKFNDNYQKITLEENYRSTQNIITAVNKTIKAMRSKIDKKLKCTRDKGTQIKIRLLDSAQDEYDYIINKTQDLLETSSKKDIAVLFRTNNLGKSLEREFRKRKIPCQLTRSIKFLEREEIKDILSFLKLKVNPNSYIDFERVLYLIPGLGKSKIQQFRDVKISNNIDYIESLNYTSQIIQKEGLQKILAKIKFLLQDSKLNPIRSFLEIFNYEEHLEKEYPDDDQRINDKLENLEVIKELFKPYGPNPDQIQAFLDSLIEIEKKEKEKDKITLSTIHSAKGLEWQHVFLAGCNEGTLPYYNKELSGATKDDELRLFYVAISRAKDSLTITSSRFNGWKTTQPSQFIDIIG